jgi:hypothetical protein
MPNWSHTGLVNPMAHLVLALAVTVIELGLIVTLMSAAGEGAATLARDTVFAAVMIILNGLIGICLLIGGLRHREQSFQQTGVSASLATLSALTVFSLVLPNYTVSEAGPVYSTSQLAFVAIVSVILYGTFVAVQTVRHRDYFLPPRTRSADVGCTCRTANGARRRTVICAPARLPGVGRDAGKAACRPDRNYGRCALGRATRARRGHHCCACSACPKVSPPFARRLPIACRPA